MNAIFKVFYDQKFGTIKLGEISENPSDSNTVVAKDAEHAILKIKQRCMNECLPAQDENGNEIKGKTIDCTGVRIHHVEFIGLVDVL